MANKLDACMLCGPQVGLVGGSRAGILGDLLLNADVAVTRLGAARREECISCCCVRRTNSRSFVHRVSPSNTGVCVRVPLPDASFLELSNAIAGESSTGECLLDMSVVQVGCFLEFLGMHR